MIWVNNISQRSSALAVPLTLIELAMSTGCHLCFCWVTRFSFCSHTPDFGDPVRISLSTFKRFSSYSLTSIRSTVGQLSSCDIVETGVKLIAATLLSYFNSRLRWRCYSFLRVAMDQKINWLLLILLHGAIESSEGCYCDHYPWTSWSSCSKSCNYGTQSRHR